VEVRNAANQRSAAASTPEKIIVPPGTPRRGIFRRSRSSAENLRVTRDKKSRGLDRHRLFGRPASGQRRFCLGALQRLAGRGNCSSRRITFRPFSGGGYTGSSFAMVVAPRSRPRMADAAFSLRRGATQQEARALQFLRGHGSYLTPGDGK